MKNHIFNRFKYIIVFALCYSCVEEIELETDTFESVFVVEATITNELIKQKILLSRSYPIDQNDPVPERNAQVVVVGNNSARYSFIETDDGLYVSEQEFRAIPNVEYHLEISTNNGKSYASEFMKLTNETKIDDLYAEAVVNDNGVNGISVFVDSYDPQMKSHYYRFEYEETYKIIARSYRDSMLIILPQAPQIPGEDPPGPDIELVPREVQVEICYNTRRSESIIIQSTFDLTEDRLDHFQVRFIRPTDFITLHRYSILVSQYIQSREAFIFYKTLNDFSSNENVFSENQLGFVEGNMFAVNDASERVVGFFEVSAVDKKRIYFNYADFYPDITPPHPIRCDEFFTPKFRLVDSHDEVAFISPLKDAIEGGLLYYALNKPPFDEEGSFAPYILCIPECGDCTNYGTTDVPDWWEE